MVEQSSYLEPPPSEIIDEFLDPINRRLVFFVLLLLFMFFIEIIALIAVMIGSWIPIPIVYVIGVLLFSVGFGLNSLSLFYASISLLIFFYEKSHIIFRSYKLESDTPRLRVISGDFQEEASIQVPIAQSIALIVCGFTSVVIWYALQLLTMVLPSLLSKHIDIKVIVGNSDLLLHITDAFISIDILSILEVLSTAGLLSILDDLPPLIIGYVIFRNLMFIGAHGGVWSDNEKNEISAFWIYTKSVMSYIRDEEKRIDISIFCWFTAVLLGIICWGIIIYQNEVK